MPTKSKRGRPPNKTEKLGAVLLEYQRLIGDPLDREHMKKLHADHIVNLFDFHHVVYDTWGGSTHPTNLTPMLKAEHRERTAKIDSKNIAKVRRANKRDAAQQMVDALVSANPRYGGASFNIFTKPLSSRPMAHGKASKTKRKLNGKVVPR